MKDFADGMRELDADILARRYALGLLAEHDGHRDAALACYQSAVRLWADADPDFPGRLDARARIAALNSASGPPRRP